MKCLRMSGKKAISDLIPSATSGGPAFEAAHAGALDTEDLAAKKGRASYLGDRSKGVIDPGAIVVSWLFGGEPLSAH